MPNEGSLTRGEARDYPGSSEDVTARIERGRSVLRDEAQAILALCPRLDLAFSEATAAILSSPGKLAVSGIGKSGHIARKVASTFSSTGTPAFFLHPGEALHGDLGMLESRDIFLAFSKSGETEEIKALLPLLDRLQITVIAIVGERMSSLGTRSRWSLDASVDKEAGPLGVAPTSSTTAMLAMGDALAMAVLAERDFGVPDFASLHPGGALGRRYFLKIRDIMHAGERLPSVLPVAPLRDVIVEMTRKKLGMTAVIDSGGHLLGVLTDGDLRRALEATGPQGEGLPLLETPAERIMTREPATLPPATLAADALALMEQRQITSVVVTGPDAVVQGVVHLHDLLKAGLVQ